MKCGYSGCKNKATLLLIRRSKMRIAIKYHGDIVNGAIGRCRIVIVAVKMKEGSCIGIG